MAEHQVTPLLSGGAFFESPRWHDGRWWVSDFYRHAVYTVTPEGREDHVLDVEGQPSGLGWLPGGDLLVASMRDRRVLRRAVDGSVSLHADLTAVSPGHLNDMVVDSSGRAWVGDFGFDLMAWDTPVTTSIKRVDPDGTVAVAADGLVFPNGAVVTPDGGTLIVGETLGNRYTAFTIGPDGTLSDRRVWALLGPEVILGDPTDVIGQIRMAPDGCCLDAELHVWSADGVGGRVARLASGGEIVDEVKAPDGLGCFACMLGGDDGRTLLMCCAPDYFEANRRDTREAILVTTRVEVPHAGLP